jgi:hypothetical protein
MGSTLPPAAPTQGKPGPVSRELYAEWASALVSA